MRSTPEDLILWNQIINERNKSGMSVSKWCKINEISKQKYHYWNNEIDFTEISSIISNKYTPEVTQSKSADFQIFFNNVQVTVPSNFNQDSLAGLMKLLQQL